MSSPEQGSAAPVVLVITKSPHVPPLLHEQLPKGTSRLPSPYLVDLPSCRRSRRPRSWWPSRACSAAACAAWPPGRTRSLPLGGAHTDTWTRSTQDRHGMAKQHRSPPPREVQRCSNPKPCPGTTRCACPQGASHTLILAMSIIYWISKEIPWISNPSGLMSHPKKVFPRGAIPGHHLFGGIQCKGH